MPTAAPLLTKTIRPWRSRSDGSAARIVVTSDTVLTFSVFSRVSGDCVSEARTRFSILANSAMPAFRISASRRFQRCSASSTARLLSLSSVTLPFTTARASGKSCWSCWSSLGSERESVTTFAAGVFSVPFRSLLSTARPRPRLAPVRSTTCLSAMMGWVEKLS